LSTPSRTDSHPAPWRSRLVLKLHARALGRLGEEPHVDFAGEIGVGLDLPSRADVPAVDDAVRGSNTRIRASALATVDRAIVDVAADSWLEHGLGDRGLEAVNTLKASPMGAFTTISKRARSTTPTSLRFRINELRTVRNSVAQNAPSNPTVLGCHLYSAICGRAETRSTRELCQTL
jgi:hypothetical protein